MSLDPWNLNAGHATGTAPHRMDIRVRYAEVGPDSVLRISAYAVYLEMGRTEMLRAAGMTYRDLEAQGLFLVVARLRLAVHQPARYDDRLALVTMLKRATRARVDHYYRLARGQGTLAEAETTLACVSRGGRIRQMPEPLLRLLGVD